MIRVLHVIDSLDLGGAQTVILQIAQHLDRTRFEMEVACMHGRGFFTEKLQQENIPVHSLSADKRIPLYVPNFMRLLAARKYDVLHFHLFGANWIAKPLAALMGNRNLIAHDHCNDRYRSENTLHIAIDRFTNRFSRKILAVSQSTADFLTQTEKIAPEKVQYLPNGMDTARFQPATAQAQTENRKRFNIPEGACVVGGIGRLHFQKNFSLFLEIAAKLKSAPENLFFVIAGTGPEENMLREKAAGIGLNHHLLFAGLVSDMPALYSTLDILLLTSHYEGMPMTVLEAMAAGIPVVGPDLDGVKEVITEGETGFLAAQNAGEFATKLTRLIDDPPLRKNFGNAARERILDRFDIRKTVGAMENLYEDLGAGR